MTVDPHTRTMPASIRRLAALALVPLLVAACGGGGSSKKSSSAADATTTSTAVSADSSTTVAGADASTSTTMAAAGGQSSSVTTVKSGQTSTAKKSSTGTTLKTVTAPGQKNTGAVLNVQATTAPPNPASAGIRPGGSIVWGVQGEVNGFDPVKMTNPVSLFADGARAPAIFDVLFYQDSVTYDVVAQLAQGITSTDGKVWQLKLRPNVKFSDGTTLDAAAVKFNYARIQDPANNSSQRSTASAITDMTVIDPLTLQLTLTTVNGQFPRVLASNLPYIGSPAALANPTAFNSKPVGAGPFTVKEYVSGDHLLLVRNPNYWNAPRPYLDQVNFRVIADDQQRYNSVNTGELDGEITNRIIDLAQATKDSKAQATATLNGGNNVIFNVSKAPFNDIRMRKAFSEAINLDDYNKTILSNIGVPAKTLFQNTSSLFENIPLSTYNPDDAKNLFKQAAADNGGKISFTLGGTAGQSQTAAEWMQGILNTNYGDYIKVDVRPQTVAQTVSFASTGDFQVQTWAQSPLDPEPALYNAYHSGLSTNFNRYSNPKMDAALETGRSSLDANARHAAYKTVQQLLADDEPSFFLARQQQGQVFQPFVQDVNLFENGDILFDRVWLKK